MLRSIALYTALVFAANAAAAEDATGTAGHTLPMRLAMGGPTPEPAATAQPPAATEPVAAPSSAASADTAGANAAAELTAAETVPASAAENDPETGTVSAASTQAADVAGRLDIAAAHAGGLSKLIETTPSAPAPTNSFSDLDGGTHSLADWKGKALLVNFWATWCAPCREEMPSLDALQKSRGGDDFAVLTIAAGRNPPAAINKFFADEGITDLPTLTDERTELARAFGVMAMPVTILIDADGNEVARMTGDADWSSPAALALVDQLRGR